MSMKTSDRHRPTSQINMAAVVVSVAGGLVMAGAAVYAGSLWVAVTFLLITWGFAALLLLGSRVSDTVALLADDVNDERHVHIHQRAALYTLNLVGLIIVGAFILDIAQGGTGSPFSYLALVSAVTYVSFLLGLSRRN